MALVVLVGLPLGLLVRSVTFPTRLKALAIMGAVFVLVVGPWVGRNLALFGHTVVLADDYGPAVAGANCATTGDRTPDRLVESGVLGSRSGPAVSLNAPPPTTEVRAARTYVSSHPITAAGAAAARLGRIWNVYRPLQSADLDAAIGRPVWVSRLGLWYFYLLVPVALVGALVPASPPAAPLPLRGTDRPGLPHRPPGLRGPPVRGGGRRGPGHAGRSGPRRRAHPACASDGRAVPGATRPVGVRTAA